MHHLLRESEPYTDLPFGVWLNWFHNIEIHGLPRMILNVTAGLVLVSLVSDRYIYVGGNLHLISEHTRRLHSLESERAGVIPHVCRNFSLWFILSFE